ncbi:MAG: WG repeat-containing protein [Anaerocolumna sp.]
MKVRFLKLSIFLLFISIFTACGKEEDTDLSINSNMSGEDNSITTSIATPIPTSTPEPTTLNYTFEDIVKVKGRQFVDGGNDFSVKSQDANYYGEITVGNRSYIEGMSDTPGPYALFVTDQPSVKLLYTFNLDGFYITRALKGVATNDTVVYNADAALLTAGMQKGNLSFTTAGGGSFDDLIGLSMVRVYFTQNDDLLGSNFTMLAVVISEDEAIRYVQDGTLPTALQGLTVTGLDEIFVNPDEETQEPENVAEITEIVSPKYGYVGTYSEGMVAVNTEQGGAGLWGYVDDSGREVMELQYLMAEPFSDGLALVQAVGGEWGFIDTTGQEVIPFGTYAYARSFSEGFATVYNKEDSCAVIDTKGNIVVPFGQYDSINKFSEGLAVVKKGNFFGVIDTAGNVVVEPVMVYSTIKPFSEGMAAVETYVDNKWGYIDNTGKEIIAPKYDNALSFSEGFAAVNLGADGNKSGGNWGFINMSGEEIISIIYSGYSYGGESFEDGTVAVVASLNANKEKVMEIIDTNRNQVASLEQYSLIGKFVDGMAVCQEGIIDKQGILLVASNEDEYMIVRDIPHADNIIPIRKDYKYGFIKIN